MILNSVIDIKEYILEKASYTMFFLLLLDNIWEGFNKIHPFKMRIFPSKVLECLMVSLEDKLVRYTACCQFFNEITKVFK